MAGIRRAAPSRGAIVTRAIVLKVSNYGDADRIVTLLTESHGKVSALARGARSSRRRFGAALSPFGYGEAVLRERPDRDLFGLDDLHASRGFPHLSQELGRFGHACYACELCLHLCPPHEPEPEVLALLLALLEQLDAQPIAERPAVEPLRAFELHLLEAVGLGLSLSACAACGVSVRTGMPMSSSVSAPGTIAGPVAAAGAGSYQPSDFELLPFDPSRGGVLCTTCYVGMANGPRDVSPDEAPAPSARSPGGGRILRSVRDALLTLAAEAPGSLPSPAALAIPRPVLTACRDLLLGIIQHHLGRNLRAVEFIAKLNTALFSSI